MNKLSIVAVGGGSPIARAEHLKKAVEMTGKEHGAHVLIIPTPATSVEKYDRRVGKAKQLYKEQLGLPVDVLHAFNGMPDYKELEEKMDWADVTYTIGGDTEHMMQEWSKYDIHKMLIARALGGLVLSGTSSGAIAPFEWGHSDPLPDREANSGEYRRVNGLGLINAAICPHYNLIQEDGKQRGSDFLNMFVNENQIDKLKYGFGIDDKASLIAENGLLRSFGQGEDTVTAIRENIEDGGISTEKMASGDTIALKDL